MNDIVIIASHLRKVAPAGPTGLRQHHHGRRRLRSRPPRPRLLLPRCCSSATPPLKQRAHPRASGPGRGMLYHVGRQRRRGAPPGQVAYRRPLLLGLLEARRWRRPRQPGMPGEGSSTDRSCARAPGSRHFCAAPLRYRPSSGSSPRAASARGATATPRSRCHCCLRSLAARRPVAASGRLFAGSRLWRRRRPLAPSNGAPHRWDQRLAALALRCAVAGERPNAAVDSHSPP